MYSIHELHGLVQKHLEQTLTKEKALSFSQFMVLVGFACEEETPLSQSTIAEYSNLTEATVSRHITTLVSLGYLSKEENKENRRKFRIAITKKGITAFKKAEIILDRELTTIFSSVSKKDTEYITKIFNTILNNLLTKK
jgi:DNA-binding MarR family transcriptional regulator